MISAHRLLRSWRALAGCLCVITATAWLPAVQAADRTAEALLLRAERLQDAAEIKNLQSIYGYYLDRSDWDAVLDLMTDDVTAEYGSSGVYIGKAHVRSLLYGIGYGKSGLRVGQLRDHIQLQPVIDVAADGQSARGRWKALVLLGQYGDYARWQTGPYENEYRKEGGRWKISRIHWYETFTVPFEGAWTTAMTQSNVADRKFPPPDAPPTFVTQPWPTVALFPYHYPNPATVKPASNHDLTLHSSDADTGAMLTRAQQITRLVHDEHDIAVLQRTYGFLVDKNLWVQIADLFTDDGTLEIGGRGVFVGKARVLQYLKFLGEPQRGKLYDHTQMEPVITVAADGNTAKGRWRALIFGADQDKRMDFLGDAIYENEYRKENGIWKISKLHAIFVLYTDFARGWGQTFWALTAPEVDLPPDRKPSARYEIYPGYTFVPYHYPNPGTAPLPTMPSVAPVAAASQKSAAADLDHELVRLEDVDSIENLQNAYGFYRDKWQWDDAARLFTKTGTRETAQRGVYVGRDSVRRSFNVDGPQGLHQGEVAEHFLYQHVIHVAPDGRTATARVRELTFAGGYGKRAEVGGEVAENTFVKEAGIWKIQSEHQYTTFWADYTKGWSQGEMPIAGPSKEFPADRPPSEVYQAFPEYYIPKFDYANPVSGKPIPDDEKGMLIDIGPLRRHRDFRLLFIGQLVSFLGSMVSYMAVPYQVYGLTHSNALVGLLGIAQLVPVLIFGLIGGAYADRLNRRRLMLACEAAMAVIVALLFLNSRLATPSLAAIFVLVAALQAIAAFHGPAMEALTQKLVLPAEYPAAGALGSFRASAGAIGGPLLGGVLITVSGLTGAYLFDLITFAWAFGCIALMSRVPDPDVQEQSPLDDAIVGVRFALSRPVLVGTYLIDIAATLFAMPVALFPALSHQWGDARMTGLLFSSMAIGSLAATALSGWSSRVHRHGRVVVLAAAGWGLFVLAAGLAPTPSLIILCLILAGGADMISGLFRGIIWNSAVPNAMRGRLAGIAMISYMSGPLLGNARAGWTASLTSVPASLWSGGAACIVAVIATSLALPKFWAYRADAAD